MRPKFLTAKNFILLLLAVTIFSALAMWIKNGMPLPGRAIPSTAGKIAFVSTRNGSPDIWMMDGADGGNAVALTDNDEDAEDRAPAWSETGSEIAFVSGGRKGVTPQIFRMDAEANAKILQVTNTSSSKYAPKYGPENNLYFLDTGKLVSYNIIANDATAILPSADLRLAMSSYLEKGGFERYDVSPDGQRYLAVLNIEEGKALTLFVPSEQALVLLGVAEDIYARFTPDGGFVVAYISGSPSNQAVPMITPEMLEQPAFTPIPLSQFRPPTDRTIIVRYNADLSPNGTPQAVPAPPDEVVFSPDVSMMVMAYSNELEDMKGLIIAPVDNLGQAQLVFDQPAGSVSWSPDGQKIAFVHNDDIYVGTASTGEVKNLTNGQGASSNPVWSPAQPKEGQAAGSTAAKP
ncbi:MAG: hypothetical protein OHK0029_28560 [Armatimonadaceae bacterium]